MSDDPVDDPRAELALVERELANAGKEAEDLRQELGSRSDGSGDPVDNATLIEQLNATESLVEDLQRRRTELQQRVGSTDGDGGETLPEE
jgi:hypothetical protein